MLATTGLPDRSFTELCAEVKLDGWRCMVAVADCRLSVRSRTGRVMTEAVPELPPMADLGRSFVLDGELCAGSGPALGTMSSFYEQPAPSSFPRSGALSDPRAVQSNPRL